MKDRSATKTHVHNSRGFLQAPSGKGIAQDGRELARQCVDGLRARPELPPQLFVLFATTSFAPFPELLAGIQAELRESRLEGVPVIGCSVAGVVTEMHHANSNGVARAGAALCGLASDLLTATPAAAADVLTDVESSVQGVVRELGVGRGDRVVSSIDPAASDNRFVICLLPGNVPTADGKSRYEVATVYAAIRKAIDPHVPMVGGVAADEFQRSDGWVFHNDTASRSGLVMALVSTDLRYGIGMATGLSQSGLRFRILTSRDAHSIDQLEQIRVDGAEPERFTPEEAMQRFADGNATILFGNPDLDTYGPARIYFPELRADGSAYVRSPIMPHWPLELLRAKPETVAHTAAEALRIGIDRGQIERRHLAASLGFICAGRFQERGQKWRISDDAFSGLAQALDGTLFTGALVYGEIGQEQFGLSVVRNWTISVLVLSDEFEVRSLHRRANRALATVGRAMAAASNLPEVLNAAISVIPRVGFAGGMIALSFKDKGGQVLVDRAAVGERWERIRGATNRPLPGHDVISRAARATEPVFVQNSARELHDDTGAIRDAGILSQAVVALRTADDKLVGVMQVDLGDMREWSAMPEQLPPILQAMAAQVASGIAHMIELGATRMMECVDHAVAAGMAAKSPDEAAQAFVNALVERPSMFGTDMVHVRLVTRNGKSLRLAAGSGDYFNVAMTARRLIPAEITRRQSPSSTTRAFASARTLVVNDVDCDADVQRFIHNVEKREVQHALARRRSVLCCVIRENAKQPPIGVIVISGTRPWFFDESRVRSLSPLGTRLAEVLRHTGVEAAEMERVRSAAMRDISLSAAVTAQVAHEVRNGIGQLIAPARTLCDQLPEGESLKLAKSIERTCDELIPRINNFLAIMQEGGLVPMELIDLVAMLQKVTRRANDGIAAGDLTVSFDISQLAATARVWIRAMPMQLEDVFANLVRNAIEASVGGGEVVVALAVLPATSEVEVRVIDHGIGMPARVLAEFQHNARHSDADERPSVGLMLARFMIYQHHGRMDIASEANKGSSVTVMLPFERLD